MNIPRFTEAADERARQYVEPAMRGDVDAAMRLVFALGNSKRGDFAVGMWRVKVDRAAYRAFLGAAWELDHAHVIAYAETRRSLAAMFKYAKFDIPASLGD